MKDEARLDISKKIFKFRKKLENQVKDLKEELNSEEKQRVIETTNKMISWMNFPTQTIKD